MKTILVTIIALLIIPNILLSQEDKNKTFFESILNCNKADIISSLENGANINAENNSGWSPLDLAILSSCSKDIIELLVDKYKANVNHINKIQKQEPTIYLLIFYRGKNKEDKELLLKYLLSKGAENTTYKDDLGLTMLDFFDRNKEDEKLYKYLYDHQKKNRKGGFPYSEKIDDYRTRYWSDQFNYTDSINHGGLYQVYEVKLNNNRKKAEEKIIRFTPVQFGGKPWVITQIKYDENESPLNNKAKITCFYDLTSPQIENYEEYEAIVEFIGEGFFSEKQKDGPYVAKYSNGNTKITGKYNKGNKEGKWIYYDTNGRVEEKEYKDDKEISK